MKTISGTWMKNIFDIIQQNTKLGFKIVSFNFPTVFIIDCNFVSKTKSSGKVRR